MVQREQQRHMSRGPENPNAPKQDPLSQGRGKKKNDPTDVEDMKNQGRKMDKVGKRGQETKNMSDTVFPTLGTPPPVLLIA